MISRFDGSATHTPINSKIMELISDRDKEIVGNAQMSSDCRPLAPPDDGYQADDEFDPHDDLADSIFGDSSPTVYFVPLPSQKVDADGRWRQIPCLSPTQCSPTPSILAKSHSPSDNGDESHSTLISYTGHSQDDSDVQTSSLSDSLPSERSETLSEDNSSSVSLPEETPAQHGGIPRVPATGHKGERHDGDIIALRETARAISGAMVDLEVLDDFYRLDGDEFGDDLVEVKPRALSICPALVAYRDGSGQITVPLEMRCNQRATSIIADLAAKFDIPPTVNNAVAGAPRSCHSNGQCDLEDFPPPPWQASDFESSDEELKELFRESRAHGRKRCHDDIEEGDDEENETGMKTHLCSPQKRRRQ